MSKGRDKKKRAAKRTKTANPPKAEPPPADLQSGDNSLVRSPLKPKPHSSAGAVAIPVPTEVEEELILAGLKLNR
jgi:hypothetical protein